MKTLVFLSFILYVFYGCLKNDISMNDNAQYDYSIEQSMSCFCPQGGEKVKIFVAADTIADVILFSNNSHLAQDLWGRYRTINGLYTEVARWDTSTNVVKVLYDSVYHYPSYVSINPKSVIINDTLVSEISDAGFSYTTKNYIKYK